MRQPYNNEIWHARQYSHKYIRRERDGHGGWRYWYPTDISEGNRSYTAGTANHYTSYTNNSPYSRYTAYDAPVARTERGDDGTPKRYLTKDKYGYYRSVGSSKSYREADKASQIYREGLSNSEADAKNREAGERRKAREAMAEGRAKTREREANNRYFDKDQPERFRAQQVIDLEQKRGIAKTNAVRQRNYLESQKSPVQRVAESVTRSGNRAYRDARSAVERTANDASKWVNNAAKDVGNAARTAVSAISTAAGSAYNAGKDFLTRLFGRK